jgi:dienelactone hydrolase
MCLAYFAMDGLPRKFSQIPLEYFQKAIGWLRAHPGVDAERVAVFGMSYYQPHWLKSAIGSLQLGGTSDGNRLARMDAWPRMVRFLREHI